MEVALQQGVKQKIVGRAQQLLQELWEGDSPALADGAARFRPSSSSPPSDDDEDIGSSSSSGASSSSSSSQSVGASSRSSGSSSISSEKKKRIAHEKAVQKALKMDAKHWKIGVKLMNGLLKECREQAAAENRGEGKGDAVA